LISRFEPTPPAFDAPVRGRFPSEYCHAVWFIKLEWCGYQTVNFEDMFIRFDTMHERDGHTHTDAQTDRPTA